MFEFPSKLSNESYKWLYFDLQIQKIWTLCGVGDWHYESFSFPYLWFGFNSGIVYFHAGVLPVEISWV